MRKVVESHICQQRAEPFDSLRSLRPGCRAPGQQRADVGHPAPGDCTDAGRLRWRWTRLAWCAKNGRGPFFGAKAGVRARGVPLEGTRVRPNPRRALRAGFSACLKACPDTKPIAVVPAVVESHVCQNRADMGHSAKTGAPGNRKAAVSAAAFWVIRWSWFRWWTPDVPAAFPT